nr:G-protein coupled receptor moody-like [Lytechinus pictus]
MQQDLSKQHHLDIITLQTQNATYPSKEGNFIMHEVTSMTNITPRMSTVGGESLVTNTPTHPSAYPNQTHTIIIATLFILVGTIGMIGNCLVLIAVLLSKKLQTATNAFVVNLSISDFLTCFVLPFQASGLFSDSGWLLSDGMCNFVAVLTITTPTVSVLTLGMIAVNRYTLITKTKKTYQQIYRLPVIAALVSTTWLFPILTIVIPQLTNLGNLGFDYFYKICKWDVDLSKIPIFQTISSVTFLASTGVIIFCYMSIYLYVRKHITDMKAKRKSQVISLQSISIEENNAAPQNRRQRSPTKSNINGTPSLRQVKITKNLCYVVIIFFVCVVPYSVLLLFRVRHLAVAYFAVVFTLSSNINPILYSAKHPDFRSVFVAMLHCKYLDVVSPSGCLRTLIDRTGATPNNKSSSES